MAAQAAIRTRNWRRWRLRILLVIQALALAAYVHTQVSPRPSSDALSPSGQKLVAEVKSLGGKAFVIQRFPGYAGLLGRFERFGVSFNGRPVDDETFGRFMAKHGDCIQSLTLLNTLVTDAGLRHLARARHLESISLGNQDATPRSRIQLPRSRITDAGLTHLQGLSYLRELSLWNIPITDAGLTSVGTISGLEALDIRRTQVKGQGLATLASVPNLTLITLEGRTISDRALASLKGAKSLQALSLMDATITGDGLRYLSTMPRLESLTLWRCGLLDEEYAALEERMPELKIDRSR